MSAEPSPIRVVGRYALYNEIAAGGMATIHLGRLLGPVGFARTVAVKRLHPQFAKDPEFVSMFLDEARLAARVQHPNVVATIDVVATDGELFLIMDYVRGESLSKLLRAIRKQGLRVPPRVAAAIMCGFLHGLHAAHEAKNERGEPLGLVHRDVSPQNVLVGSDGIARVLDFGIAKAAGRIQVTRDGQIKGKLAYMPPEQLAGRAVTRAVDIYASAVVMWETLTTERLFKGESEAETLSKIIREPVLAPSEIIPSLPLAFDAPIMRALSRDPSKRHSTARELALELERCAGIASPTEVGEWVEEIVGHVLSAREDQIAEIESNSVSLRMPVQLPESESDSDVSVARPPFVLDPNEHTMKMGSGHWIAPIGPPPSSRGTKRVPPPRTRLPSMDDPTGSSRFTGSGMTVPTDRRLPIFASLAGLIVLVALVSFILLRKAPPSARATAAQLPPSAAPPTSAVLLADPVTIPTASDVTPAEPPAPSETVSARPVAVPHPAPAPKPAPRPVAPAAPAKDCDPPYTIDAQGRRKYKRECM
jgi:eukaryotic-like serine/threonine-protein kinase